jgi:hypothetical protein
MTRHTQFNIRRRTIYSVLTGLALRFVAALKLSSPRGIYHPGNYNPANVACLLGVAVALGLIGRVIGLWPWVASGLIAPICRGQGGLLLGAGAGRYRKQTFSALGAGSHGIGLHFPGHRHVGTGGGTTEFFWINYSIKIKVQSVNNCDRRTLSEIERLL